MRQFVNSFYCLDEYLTSAHQCNLYQGLRLKGYIDISVHRDTFVHDTVYLYKCFISIFLIVITAAAHQNKIALNCGAREAQNVKYMMQRVEVPPFRACALEKFMRPPYRIVTQAYRFSLIKD